jgi:hypothetical protein
MKQETKAVILVVLIVVLGAVAYFVIFRSKAAYVVALLPGATTTTTQPSGDKALPAPEDVAFLKQWLAGREAPTPKTQVTFGLVVPPKSTPAGPEADPAASAGDPLRLDGIIKTGRTPKAIIGGEAYSVGQTVRYTAFSVVTVTDGGVKLRSSGGQEMVLVLQK